MEDQKERTIQVVNPQFTLVYDIAFKFLKKDPEDHPVLLDAGCGRGHHTENLRRIGYETTGIDISCDDVSLAKNRYPYNTFFQHDLNNKLPFSDNCFDVIFSNSV